MRIDLHHYIHYEPVIDQKLDLILHIMEEIKTKENTMSLELDNLNAGITALTATVNEIATVEASAEATLAALVAKQVELQTALQAAIDAGNTAGIQDAANALAAQTEALNNAKTSLAAAIANVPV